jgi:hypothetical protein
MYTQRAVIGHDWKGTSMLKQILRRTVLCLIAFSPLRAQLYVIAGSPTPHSNENFGVALVRIGDDGSVSKAASLFSTSFNAGLAWISASQEARKATLLPHGGGTGHIVVVDFDEAAVNKECDLPTTPMPVVYSRLADLPGRGLALAEEMFADGHEKYAGFLLDKAVPCEKSLVDMAPTDILGLRVLGRTGVSDAGNDEAMNVQIDSAGRVTLRLLGVSFPFAIPEAMMAGMHDPLASILVDNPRLVAIGLFERAAPHRILVYRRRDQTWHRLPVPSESVFVAGGQATPTPWLTGFGDFLALTEARTKDAQFRETAGKAAWKSEATATGPSMAARFAGETVVFPGRLHLYDMEHDRSYTISTEQGDSEVLLVEAGMVYYRVGDSLYKSSIGETALGSPQLLAKSEILGDAHWAFIKPK